MNPVTTARQRTNYTICAVVILAVISSSVAYHAVPEGHFSVVNWLLHAGTQALGPISLLIFIAIDFDKIVLKEVLLVDILFVVCMITTPFIFLFVYTI